MLEHRAHTQSTGCSLWIHIINKLLYRCPGNSIHASRRALYALELPILGPAGGQLVPRLRKPVPTRCWLLAQTTDSRTPPGFAQTTGTPER
jgi:hypothetical protein